LEKAKQLDPTNIYIAAFKERILYFEQLKKKELMEAAHRKVEGIRKPDHAGVVPAEEEHITEPPAATVPVQEQEPEQEERMEPRGIPREEERPSPMTPPTPYVPPGHDRRVDEEKIVHRIEKNLLEVRNELLRRVDDEMQKVAEEGRQIEHRQRQLDDKLKTLRAEIALLEEKNKKFVVEEELRRLLQEERKKTAEEFKLRVEPELQRIKVELERKADEESLRRLEQEFLAWKASASARQQERWRTNEELELRVERELLGLREELQKKADGVAVRKLEEEFLSWKEADATHREEQRRREVEAKVKREAQLKKIQEYLERAREFRALKQYNEALVELRQVYVLDPTYEEAHRLDAEIRAEEAEERKLQIEQKLEEMRQQIEQLSRTLEQEKQAREEMSKSGVKRAIAQFRAAMEKAWVNGAPDAATANELHKLAVSLAIPEVVEQSIKREVKVEMYGRAVKEAIAKRHLVRSSSSTLEWLRKVYEITLEEYLEYESKFLVDLVADQYKGTILLVSNDPETKEVILDRLKSSGYAVVVANTPEEALEKVEKLLPNFIFCEMEFAPGNLSGIKFLHILRLNAKYSYLPFILFCDPKRMQEIPANDLRPNEGLVEKPIDIDNLLEVMGAKLQAFRDYVSSLS
jgi:CheY-like chemotaxis protein